MSFYWANFQMIGWHTFRFDTRIYFDEKSKPDKKDQCVGAVVGVNPGSAFGPVGGGLQSSDGDPTLDTMRRIIYNAYQQGCKQIRATEYVQVLNLF